MALLSPRRLTRDLSPQRLTQGAHELAAAIARADRRAVGKLAGATAAVAALTAVDLYGRLARSRPGPEVTATAVTTIRRDGAEVYQFWRRLDNLAGFMAHVDEVRVTGERTSHWRVGAPFGRQIEWDAEITEDEPGRRLCWRSTADADVPNSGCVELAPAPGDRGTELRVQLTYRLPGGALGAAVTRWAGEDPHQQLDDDLRRCKQLLEAGEIARSDGAPGGKRARHEFPQRPAQPVREPAEVAA